MLHAKVFLYTQFFYMQSIIPNGYPFLDHGQLKFDKDSIRFAAIVAGLAEKDRLSCSPEVFIKG